MGKGITITLIILVLLAFFYLVFFYDRGEQEKALPFDEKNVSIQIRDMSLVPEEYYSGSSRYSQGICNQDKECSIQGCSKEVCSSKNDISTSCEILENQPSKETYECGCIKDRCGWYLKN